jgi:hypothetical protein
MSKEYHGACMCRSIRFSFFGPPRFVADCVCESCRKAHGASAVCWVGVKAPEFRIDSGEQLLKWYRSSAKSERGFCMACGTRFLFRSDKWPGEVHMALACVDSPHDLKSTGVGFEEEFPAWSALALTKQG